MKEYTRNKYFQPNEQICIQNSYGAHSDIHIHDFIEIVYIRKGSARQIINGTQYPVRRGTLLFINCGQTHAFSSPKPFSYYNLMITPEFISDQLINSGNLYEMLSLSMFEEFQLAKSVCRPLAELPGEIIPEIETLFASLFREYRDCQPGRLTLMRSYLTVILTHIFRRLCRPDETIITPELLRYIEEHCSERLSLNTLAKKCFYHPSYLSRMFHELQGQTLTEYITQVRLKKAAGLLTSTMLPIDDICTSCGFGDKTMFYKKFREWAGCSPAEFRKNQQK